MKLRPRKKKKKNKKKLEKKLINYQNFVPIIYRFFRFEGISEYTVAFFHQVANDPVQKLVVGSFFKVQVTRVVEKLNKQFGKPTTQVLDGRVHLLFANFFVLLTLGFRIDSLPRKTAQGKIDNDIT